MKKLIGCLVLGGSLLCPTEAGIAQLALNERYTIMPYTEQYRPKCRMNYMKEEFLLDGKPNRAIYYRKGKDLRCYEFLENPKKSVQELNKSVQQAKECIDSADMLLLSTNNDGIYDAVKVLKGSPCEKCHRGNKVKI